MCDEENVKQSRKNSVFMPVNEDHSIERISFALNFRQAFHPAAITAIIESHDEWRAGLPATSGLVDVPNNSGAGVASAPGVFFSFLKPNGEATWSMQIGRNEIRIDCYLYTRWEKVWAAAFNYFSKALSAVPDRYRSLELLHVEMLVRDVFIARDKKYNLKSFVRNEEYISPHLLGVGSLWHCNTGWFEDFESPGRILHNLNLSTRALGGESQEVQIDVEHKQIKSADSTQSLDDLIDSKFNVINDIMTSLHGGNKNLLTRLLCDDIVEMIGLKAVS